MKKIALFAILLLLTASTCCFSQVVQPYGQVDAADLHLKYCAFDKEAAAMILFDKADVVASFDSVVLTQHQRIKIFNSNGYDIANRSFRYNPRYEKLVEIKAQTINYENGKTVTVPVDVKDIYNTQPTKNRRSVIFTYPALQPGSIVEFTFKVKISGLFIPDWSFQHDMPTRYSEIDTKAVRELKYSLIKKGTMPFFSAREDSVIEGKYVYQVRNYAMANVPAIADEPYAMQSDLGVQRLLFELKQVIADERTVVIKNSWLDVCKRIMKSSFGFEMDRRTISKSEYIDSLAHKTEDEKIAYIFNFVRSNMKWNNKDSWYPGELSLKSTWKDKIGNSGQINLILYNTLTDANIKCYMMLVSTPDNGTLTPVIADESEVNKAVVYLPTADTSKYYVLDASDKYALYNTIPADLLNRYGIKVNMETATRLNCQFIPITSKIPALQSINMEGEIAPGKISGTTTGTYYSYWRSEMARKHDKLNEKDYLTLLAGKGNDFKISNLKFDSPATDEEPLKQKFNFTGTSSASDGNYIYFNPAQFAPFSDNPFTSETRATDIDLHNNTVCNITGHFKLPLGYKVDALPANIVMNMPDKSISFKRLISEKDGYLEFNYSVSTKRSVYYVDEYKALHTFFKQLYDMVNEPVVLKKI